MTKKQHDEPQDKQYASPEQWRLQNFPSSYEQDLSPSAHEYPFETSSIPKSTQELLSVITNQRLGKFSNS